jgi:hypothetical protein
LHLEQKTETSYRFGGVGYFQTLKLIIQ